MSDVEEELMAEAALISDNNQLPSKKSKAAKRKTTTQLIKELSGNANLSYGEKKLLLELSKRITKCHLGAGRCRACAKDLDHRFPPPHIKCVYCGAIQNFFRLRTGNIRREVIYVEDDKGNQVPLYDKNGNFTGYKWYYGDRMYYEDGTPIPETKFAICCGSDACKFYKIPIDEVQQWVSRTNGRLDRV
jgi:hypothetical protein